MFLSNSVGALLPRVFGSSASDFDVRWVRSGRQVCLNGPWTASWRVLLKLKALRPFQEVNLLLSREELCNRRLNFGRLWSTTFWKYWAVDHLARGSMKNAANCASECELQDIWASTLWTHIADCGLSTVHVWLRVGLSSIQLNCWHWASPSLHREGGLKFDCASLRTECWLSGCLLSLGWR